jgi:hydroxymethylglutaryl-CoA reductase
LAKPSSRIAGFHTLERADRLASLAKALKLGSEQVEEFGNASAALGSMAAHMVENAIGTMNIPLGIATNMIVDGTDVVVPMATEESSVIAAVCNGARQCRTTNGVRTSTTGPLMIAQVQITGIRDPFAARGQLFEKTQEIAKICNEMDPILVEMGGGFRDIEVRVLDTVEPMVILHLIVDTRDAMGANAVNTMAEAVAPHVSTWTGGKVELRILSNLADRRLVRANAVWPVEKIGGESVRDAMVRAGEFANADPYRATTHNKGIMNGVSAVVLATGNDTRAVEAGAHAYAARSGRYSALTRWEVNADGALSGSLEMPLAVGIVGGATKVHPTAQFSLSIMGAPGADRLARIAGAVGLVQNFSALKALATEGIQRGHMTLHAKNVAMMAGADPEEVGTVAEALIESGVVRQDVASRILKKLRNK